jgi:hypothetical protein
MNVPRDKVMDFCAGLVVATLTVSIAAVWLRNIDILAQIAVWSAFSHGISYEAYNYFTSKARIKYFNVLATVLGGGVVCVILLTCL